MLLTIKKLPHPNNHALIATNCFLCFHPPSIPSLLAHVVDLDCSVRCPLVHGLDRERAEGDKRNESGIASVSVLVERRIAGLVELATDRATDSSKANNEGGDGRSLGGALDVLRRISVEERDTGKGG